jgi:DNA-binding IscR family transcriptional regulator
MSILRGGPCHWDDMCAVHTAWFTAMQACRDSLRRTTLADLATDEELRRQPLRGLGKGPRRLPRKR